MRVSTNLIIVLALSLAALILVWLDQTWLMPGPVSLAHAKIEAQCRKCHTPWKGVARNSCLACKQQMKYVDDRGLHRYAPIKECRVCHREHRTRQYPLASAWVNPATFDHGWTGFNLKPWHAKSTCDQCHPRAGTYRILQKTSGFLLEFNGEVTCQECHTDFNPVAWRHEKSACNLDPTHGALKCAYCHTRGWGQGVKPSCAGCHPENIELRSVCQEAPSSIGSACQADQAGDK